MASTDVYTPLVDRAQADLITPTIWNADIASNGRYDHDSPRASVFITANQTLTTGVADYINWDGERYATTGMHDTGASPEEVVLPRAGIWSVGCNIEFAAHSSGIDVVQLEIDGILIAQAQVAASSDFASQHSLSGTWQTLDTDNVMKVSVSQTSGGDVDIVRTSNYYPMMWATWLKDNV